jgi:hypothetical protein
MTDVAPPLIQMREAADGTLTYLVATPPEALPPVIGRDLARAWSAVRALLRDAGQRAGLGATQARARLFRFMRPDGGHIDLALRDGEQRRWAAAVDRLACTATSYGLSLLLRLLALVDLLRRCNRAAPDGPPDRLLRAAAVLPLSHEARFEEAPFRALLAPLTPLTPGVSA